MTGRGSAGADAGGSARLWGAALVALAFDLALLGPLLTSSSLARGETKRVYFEPLAIGVDLLLDEQQAGYMTEVEVDGEGNLAIPSGRTIALPLAAGATVTVRTSAGDLAPYVVLGSAEEIVGADQRDRFDRPARFANPAVLGFADGALVARPWDAARPWAQDRAWLSELRARCDPAAAGALSVRADPQGVAVQLGTCRATVPYAAASQPPLLMVVSGLHGATVSRPAAWRVDVSVSRELIAVALLRLLLLAFAFGAAPAAVSSATLFAIGLVLRPAAILVWFVALPIAAVAAAVRLVRRRAPHRPALAWVSGAVVLAAEIGAVLAAIALFDFGSFGKERFTRDGDDACAVVGYSTVRGDSLRGGSEGLVERLNDSCAPCRLRTSRFSREAQTLRWVREVVCAPGFPTAAAGDVIFFGGGNDDIFYRPGRFRRVVGVFLNLLRYALQPVDALDWEGAFAQANHLALATLDEQAADIAASIGCARERGRRFWFVHDFLLWDLGRGRTPDREQSFAARRAAVLAAGGTFIDLSAEFGDSAGVAWFNDWIHPSGYGQRQFADLLCERIIQSAGAAPRGNSRVP